MPVGSSRRLRWGIRWYIPDWRLKLRSAKHRRCNRYVFRLRPGGFLFSHRRLYGLVFLFVLYLYASVLTSLQQREAYTSCPASSLLVLLFRSAALGPVPGAGRYVTAILTIIAEAIIPCYSTFWTGVNVLRVLDQAVNNGLGD